jgi:hypothetical protein
MTTEMDSFDSTEAEAYRAEAKRLYVHEGTLEIDSGAIVSRSDDGGAYVAAWVWVGDLCRTCLLVKPDGEGYDGECETCADKTETARERESKAERPCSD